MSSSALNDKPAAASSAATAVYPTAAVSVSPCPRVSLSAPLSLKMHFGRLARVWLLLAFTLVGLGLGKGINLLTLLGWLMLAVLAGSLLTAGRRLRRLRGGRRIAGPVFAGIPVTIDIDVDNPGRGTQQALLISDPSPLGPAEWFVPQLRGRQSAHFRHEVTCPRRGAVRWRELCAVSGYPFGVVEREAVLAAGQEVIVLPRLGQLHRGRLRAFLASGGSAGYECHATHRRHPTARTEFHGLRAFRSGDSPRWIHWRTSARCGELMVREFEELARDNLTLVVDPWLPPGAPPRKDDLANLETMLSFAATVCWEWCRQKGDRFVLAVGAGAPIVLDGITSTGHALQMLELLAVQAGQPERTIAALGECPQLQSLPAGPILLVETQASSGAERLARRWHRPVLSLDPGQLRQVDFYESPSQEGE